MKPKRIVRKRTKGFRLSDLSDNYVIVSRPSKFGNPFRDMQDMVYVYSYRREWLGIDPWIYLCMKTKDRNAITYYRECVLNTAMVYGYFRDLCKVDRDYIFEHFTYIALHLPELKGKDLACWCKISEPCHADILLKLANQ